MLRFKSKRRSSIHTKKSHLRYQHVGMYTVHAHLDAISANQREVLRYHFPVSSVALSCITTQYHCMISLQGITLYTVSLHSITAQITLQYLQYYRTVSPCAISLSLTFPSLLPVFSQASPCRCLNFDEPFRIAFKIAILTSRSLGVQ